MAPENEFIAPWKDRVHEVVRQPFDDFPNYHLPSNADCLVTNSRPCSFQIGTGASIYTNTLLPAILEARREVILVTCFWAPSSSLRALKETLQILANWRKEFIEANIDNSEADALPQLHVRIGLSSRSLFQKLFHTSSRDGYEYPPSTWSSKLDLPSPDTLEAGRIFLSVKSLFFLPFSVMHPKFLIVDRQRAWLPSCNVSWESWLEGCIEITGDAVAGLVRFYHSVWTSKQDGLVTTPSVAALDINPTTATGVGLNSIDSPARRLIHLPSSRIPTVILPSSHHRNPAFRFFPWSKCSPPPPTPLNEAILQLLEVAERSAYIQTPNLTSPPVLDAILKALKRGVDVELVTSKGMMVLEQILTAGTTTSLCIRSLTKKYEALISSRNRLLAPQNGSYPQDAGAILDSEAQHPTAGQLTISYFHANQKNLHEGIAEEPVHSHIKLTIVDKRYTVLGSGNMDRASWFTSQELGVLFFSTELANAIRETVVDVLKGRKEIFFLRSPQ